MAVLFLAGTHYGSGKEGMKIVIYDIMFLENIPGMNVLSVGDSS